MEAHLIAVSTAQPRVIWQRNGETVVSAIGKTVVAAERVRVGTLNIVGDAQADLRVHGGSDKAVYSYSADHWHWWETHGLSCRPATFGENLTLAGVDEAEVCIGDRFRWSDVLLEVSEPRAPCYKLGIHTAREDVPPLMTRSARCGWYFRVIEEGEAPTRNTALTRVHASGGPSVRDAFIAALHPSTRELCLRVHDAPALAEAWRRTLAKKLANMTP